MMHSSRATALLLFVSAITVAAQQPGLHPVTSKDLLKGSRSFVLADVCRRLQRAASLSCSTTDPQNVGKLTPQWTLKTDIPGFPGRGIETTPLVVDGVMYVTGNGNRAWAIDARTGHQIWSYERTLAAEFRRLGLLRAGQSRLRGSRRSPVHGHARRQPDRTRPAFRSSRCGRRKSAT